MKVNNCNQIIPASGNTIEQNEWTSGTAPWYRSYRLNDYVSPPELVLDDNNNTTTTTQ